jgi:hypothetical protein
MSLFYAFSAKNVQKSYFKVIKLQHPNWILLSTAKKAHVTALVTDLNSTFKGDSISSGGVKHIALWRKLKAAELDRARATPESLKPLYLSKLQPLLISQSANEGSAFLYFQHCIYLIMH